MTMQAIPMNAHRPGWTVTVPDGDGETEFKLWAPNPVRAGWRAGWDSDGGGVGNFRNAATAEAAMDCFPLNTEADQARAVLLAAAMEG